MAFSWSIISLCVLAIVVAIGFIKKINIGFLSIGAAFLLGSLTGIKEKIIIGGFDASMFVTLVGVTFLFGLASVNGTLELMSKKIIAMLGRRTYLIPIMLFFLSAFLSAMGPGHIAVGILMTTFAVYLAIEMKINVFATALYAKLGANAGCASVISPTGVIAAGLAEKSGYSGFGTHLMITTFLSGLFFALVIYVFYKGYKVNADNPLKLADLPKFDRKQLLTMIVMTILVVVCILFKINVGLSSFVAASILILARAVDEVKAIKAIPWSTLILIVGVGMLISVIDRLGGVKLISDMLVHLMTQQTAVPIIAATAGTLSWVSSTTGVVMPTMFPIAAEVVKSFGGSVGYVELISAITAASFAAAISPLSTGGAIIISAYSSAAKIGIAEQNRLFKILFLLSAANVACNVLFAYIGMFSLFGFGMR